MHPRENDVPGTSHKEGKQTPWPTFARGWAKRVDSISGTVVDGHHGT